MLIVDPNLALPLTHRMLDPKLGGGAILDLYVFPCLQSQLGS